MEIDVDICPHKIFEASHKPNFIINLLKIS